MQNKILGLDRQNQKVYINPSAKNLHVGIWGGTGSGKTSWIDAFLLELATAYDCPNRIFRFAWHSCTQRDQRIPAIAEELDYHSFIIKADDNLPMRLFDPERRDSLNARQRVIEIDRITDIVASAANLPLTHRAATLAAVKNVYNSEDPEFMRQGLRAIGENLLCLGYAAGNAYAKLHSVFEGVNFTFGDIEFEREICELDLNAFDHEAQRVIMNLLLAYYYEKAKRDEFIEAGISFVIDEAQNADLRDGQILSEMMMESRKKNVRMILATPQPLTDTKKFEAMLQCGTQLFFKPAGYENKLAKLIDPRHEMDMTLLLKQLKVGEFVAVGSFVREDGTRIDRPIKLRTYIPEYLNQKYA